MEMKIKQKTLNKREQGKKQNTIRKIGALYFVKKERSNSV